MAEYIVCYAVVAHISENVKVGSAHRAEYLSFGFTCTESWANAVDYIRIFKVSLEFYAFLVLAVSFAAELYDVVINFFSKFSTALHNDKLKRSYRKSCKFFFTAHK